MRRGTVAIVTALLLAAPGAVPGGGTAHAFNQPPMNLGLTDILDGGVPGVGTFFTEYVQAYQANKLVGPNGDTIPGGAGVATVLSMNQLVHIYKHKVAGAHLGVDTLLPVVAIATEGQLPPPIGPVTSNTGVLGDITIGPLLQWLDTKLLGRPFVHRLELDFTIPTGQHDSRFVLNPGANHWVIEPYYAFTWFLTPQLSTSWRIHYTYSLKNNDPFDGLQAAGISEITPGQAFHFNYSFEYEIAKGFRGAVAGYYLKQLTEDESNAGDIPDSKEQVFAIGPAVHYFFSKQFSAGLKTAWETSTENRPEGNRTTLRFTYLF